MNILNRTEVGIDLGSKYIKITTIRNVEVDTNIHSGSYNPDLRYVDKSEAYEVDCVPYSKDYYDLLKRSLKSFSKKNKMFFLSLNISLPVDNTTNGTTMFINMPAINEKDLDNALGFEVEQEMAFNNIEDSTFTWKISEQYEDSGEYEILVTTIKNNILSAFASFKTINWKLNRLIAQPILLERTIAGDSAVIDFGHSSTKVYLYNNGKLKQTEIINVAGEQLTNKIKNYLEENDIEDVSADEALKSIYLLNDAFDMIDEAFWDKNDSDNDEFEEDDNNAEFQDDISEYSPEDDNDNLLGFESNDEKVVDERKKKRSFLPKPPLSFFSKKEDIAKDDESNKKYDTDDDTDSSSYLEDNSSKELIFSEGLSNSVIRDLSEHVKDDLVNLIDEVKSIVRAFELENGLAIEEVHYFGQLAKVDYLVESIEADLGVTMNKISVLAETEESLDYLIAAMAAMDPKLNDGTNFAKLIKLNIDYTSILIATLAISLSMGLALKVMDTKYEETIDELENIEQKQNMTLSEIEADKNSVEREISTNESFIDKMEMLKAQKKWLSDILYMVPDLTPTTVAIKDMDIESGNVTIEGYSADYSSIGFFSKELGTLGMTEIDSIDNYDGEDGDIYSVTTADGKNISSKYKITKKFKITLIHNDGLVEH